MIPIIMAGGSGTRLWPLSREFFPKQFLSLTSKRTMLQDTVERVAEISGIERPIVLCKEEHRFLVGEQFQQIGIESETIILEPVDRDTAPAITIAALHVLSTGGDQVLLVLPTDHVINDLDNFRKAVAAGEKLAKQGNLVTFGIVPGCAETAYGYIRRGSGLSEVKEAFRVDSFVEKPDLETARRYLESGDYLWNSGMFMFQASTLLDEMEKYAPEITAACREAFDNKSFDLDFLRLDKPSFSACPNDSIDYAVMEKTGEAVVVPLDCGWSDVGSWSSLQEVSDNDADGNVVKGDVIVRDSSGCYLRAESRLLAVVGLCDHIVIETSDAVVVAPRDRSEDVKKLVEQLKADNRGETIIWHPSKED